MHALTRSAGHFRAHLLILLLVALVAPAVSSPATAQVCTGFRPARLDTRATSPQLARPIVVLPGEFTGDSYADLVVINRYIDGFLQNGSITVLRGDLTGSFTPMTPQIIDGGATSAALADFNGDDRQDVAAVNSERVMVFRSTGSGGFFPPVDIPLGFQPSSVLAADMDGDALKDLIVVQQYVGQPGGRVTVLKGNGQLGFTPLAPVTVGQSPLSGVVGDFNADGKLDVVTGSSLTSTVTFLPGLGNGGFGSAITSNLGLSTWYIASQDLNADNRLDLVISSQSSTARLAYARGEGDGRFTFITSVPDGADPRAASFCDFDKNGKPDVVVPNAGSGNVTLWLNQGGGAFSAPVLVGTDSGPSSTTAVDLNADGFCDVATANEGSDSVSVLLGGLQGSLGAPLTPTGPFPLAAAADDFNGDGNLDVAVVSRDDDMLRTYVGDGQGGLYLSQVLATGDAPGAVASGDFNADGAPDLVVANQGVAGDQANDTVSVYYNNGLGGLSLAHTLVVGDLPLDVKAADLNNDGREDLAVANSRSDKLTVYLAEPFNGFGNVKSIRVGEFQRSLAIADFSADGQPDVAVSVMGQNYFVVMVGSITGNIQKGPTKVLPGTAAIDQIFAADVNGDLAADLVAIGQPADPYAPGELTSLLGTGEGDFFETPFPPVSTGIRPESLAVLDLDQSGTLDVVVANRYDNDILTFTGSGTGEFFTGSRYGTGNDPFFLVPGDFNNDSRIDVAAVNGGGASVSILLNNFPIPDLVAEFTFFDPTRLVWTSAPGINAFRLYRDLLDTLGPDHFGLCLSGSLNVTEFFDQQIPPLNQGYFYLLTTVENGLEGPLGFSTECLKRPNFNPCPS